MSEDPIQVRSLVHVYDRDPVLSIPELTLGPGRYHLAGPNGAGKSTLLRILATLLRPSRGEIHLLGYDLPEQATHARARLGYAGHETSLHGSLPARPALAVHARLHGLGLDRVDEALATWDLGPIADRRVDALSHGQQRRLDLARALLHRPEVLLLDEPTAGLDEAAHGRLAERLRELEPALVLAASPEEAPIPVDERLRLRGGRLEVGP